MAAGMRYNNLNCNWVGRCFSFIGRRTLLGKRVCVDDVGNTSMKLWWKLVTYYLVLDITKKQSPSYDICLIPNEPLGAGSPRVVPALWYSTMSSSLGVSVGIGIRVLYPLPSNQQTRRPATESPQAGAGD
jgi:hypothetical protein